MHSCKMYLSFNSHVVNGKDWSSISRGLPDDALVKTEHAAIKSIFIITEIIYTQFIFPSLVMMEGCGVISVNIFNQSIIAASACVRRMGLASSSAS